MKFDLTITISVILALSAILSPIFVSIINNNYQLKLKRIENYDIAKRNSLENFTKNVGEYFTLQTIKSRASMTNSLYALIPYFKIDFISIKSIIENSEEFDVVMDQINTLIRELKMQL